jgi:uncharacterized protein (TIGR00369 family)
MNSITIAELEALTRAELPLAGQLGLRVEQLGHGSAIVRLPFRDELNRPGGTISGPAMMALADYSMYAVVLSTDRTLRMAVTTNLNINFLRKPGPTDLIADAKALKIGKRLAVLEVTIRSDGSDEPVAHVTGTYSIPA